jgi:hypothetical protein
MEAMQEIYPDIERQMMGCIRSGARRFVGKVVGKVDEDDIVQYGRLVTWKAVQKYDVNSSDGNIEKFVARCLRNAYASLLAKMMSKSRMPRYIHRSGEAYETRPLPPTPASAIHGIWEWYADTGWTLDPERVLEVEDDELEFDGEISDVFSELDDRQRFVLDVLMNPPPELMRVSVELGGNVDEPPLKIAVVRWLHPLLTKNQIDNILNRIRRVIYSQVERGGFSEEFAAVVYSNWTSRGTKRREDG